MKTKTFFSMSLLCIATCHPLFTNVSSVKAQANNPNNVNHTESGWMGWEHWNQKDPDLNYGFNPQDAEAFLNLEKVCFGEVNTPRVQKQMADNYWYRKNNSLQYSSYGEIQIGCWNNGRFKSHITIAVNRNNPQSLPYQPPDPANPYPVNPNLCRQVQTPVKDGLVIRSGPSLSSPQIGGVTNGDTITLTNYPPNSVFVDGYNWIQIQAPVRGWISHGRRGDKGNLILCR